MIARDAIPEEKNSIMKIPLEVFWIDSNSKVLINLVQGWIFSDLKSKYTSSFELRPNIFISAN